MATTESICRPDPTAPRWQKFVHRVGAVKLTNCPSKGACELHAGASDTDNLGQPASTRYVRVVSLNPRAAHHGRAAAGCRRWKPGRKSKRHSYWTPPVLNERNVRPAGRGEKSLSKNPLPHSVPYVSTCSPSASSSAAAVLPSEHKRRAGCGEQSTSGRQFIQKLVRSS